MGFLTQMFEQRFHPSQEPPAWVADLSGWLTGSGVSVTPETALSSVAVFACVRILAESIASLPLVVYRRLPAGGKARAPDHYLYPILHDLPNPEMTSFEFRETLMGHLGTWGNAFAEIDIDGAGRARELWPLRPDKMKVRRRSGQLQYVYTLPDKFGAQPLVLPKERILHVRGLGFDGIVGYSPIQLARQAVGLSLATEEFGARFFGGGARPGAVLEHPAKLSDEAHKRLRESWEERHMGLEKAHRVAILEEGMKLHEVGIPPEDAQFLQTRQFQTEEIARLYRVPLHLVQLHEKSTSWGTGIEQMNIGFAVYTLLPWITRWEQAIFRDVLLPGDRRVVYVKLVVDGLLRGDQKSRYDAYATGRQWGWLSANDVRELEDMNPIEGGDLYMVPLNMVPAATPTPGPSPVGGGGDTVTGGDRAEQRAVRSAAARRKLAEAYRRVIADAAGRVVRREINDVRNAAQRFLKKRDVAQFNLWLDDFYSQDHLEFIRRQMLPAMLSYAEAVVAEAADEVGGQGGMTPDLEEFVNSYVGSLAARHVGSSLGQIRALLREGMGQRQDPEEAALAALEERFAEWEEKRVDKIADDERIQANNAVALFFYGLAGILRKRWLAFGENCPYCSRLNGRVVGIEQWFLAAGEQFQPEGAASPLMLDFNVGHPPAHRGCDCMVVAGL